MKVKLVNVFNVFIARDVMKEMAIFPNKKKKSNGKAHPNGAHDNGLFQRNSFTFSVEQPKIEGKHDQNEEGETSENQ